MPCLQAYGLPKDLVSERGPQFVSRLTTSLLKLRDIQWNRSTAYHPQSDGQTERVNQVLEQFLCIFCNYQQTNWTQLLLLAEFAYNNAKHSYTELKKISPTPKPSINYISMPMSRKPLISK